MAYECTPEWWSVEVDGRHRYELQLFELIDLCNDGSDKDTWGGRRTRAASKAKAREWPFQFPKLACGGAARAGAKDSPANFDEGGGKNADDSYTSRRLLPLSEADLFDDDALLRAHGFDPANWTLKSTTYKRYQMASKREDGTGNEVTTLFGSTVTAVPARNKFDPERVAEALCVAKPIKIPRITKVARLMGVVNLCDMHLGPSTLAWYKDQLERAVAWMREWKRELIVVTIGNDLFHNDNMIGTTESGTFVDKMDVPTVWAEAYAIYTTIISEALKNARDVHVIYVKDNHGPTFSWAFCKLLEHTFPQVTFDLEIAERKVHRWEGVCIGLTHGDRQPRDIDRVFLGEFPDFASARIREVLGAHVHHEEVKDYQGTVVRKNPTAAKTDGYHADNGYVGQRKHFALYDYTPDRTFNVRYI